MVQHSKLPHYLNYVKLTLKNGLSLFIVLLYIFLPFITEAFENISQIDNKDFRNRKSQVFKWLKVRGCFAYLITGRSKFLLLKVTLCKELTYGFAGEKHFLNWSHNAMRSDFHQTEDPARQGKSRWNRGNSSLIGQDPIVQVVLVVQEVAAHLWVVIVQWLEDVGILYELDLAGRNEVSIKWVVVSHVILLDTIYVDLAHFRNQLKAEPLI